MATLSETDVTMESSIEVSEVSTDFQKLPPEMVTAILKWLVLYPDSLLTCRLVCSQFKFLVDDILEQRQWSLWSWSKGHGEGKPYLSPGPIKRPLPASKIFQDSGDIGRFLEAMTTHRESGLNPFSCRSIYIRRLRGNLPFPLQQIKADTSNCSAGLETQTMPQIRRRSLSSSKLYFFEHQNDSQGNEASGMLSVEKIVSLLDLFGEHLTSLILECGVTTDLESVKELADILEKVPNLQYLMLKGVRIKDSKADELPPLPYLKSLKIIHCSGVTRSLLTSYQGQLSTLQLLNSLDYWLNHLEVMQQDFSHSIFGKLRSLKIGEFKSPEEFDYLTQFLKSQQEKMRPLRLERVAIHYSMPVEFLKPSEKLFQILEYLPNIREFSVGKCANTSFQFDPQEAKNNFNVGGNTALAKISLPVQFIPQTGIIRKIFRSIRTLDQIRFLDCNSLLWDISSTDHQKLDQALGLPENMTLPQVLREFMQKDFSSISKISVVTSFGDNERVLCTVSDGDQAIL